MENENGERIRPKGTGERNRKRLRDNMLCTSGTGECIESCNLVSASGGCLLMEHSINSGSTSGITCDPIAGSSDLDGDSRASVGGKGEAIREINLDQFPVPFITLLELAIIALVLIGAIVGIYMIDTLVEMLK